jgi:hypothetical protein
MAPSSCLRCGKTAITIEMHVDTKAVRMRSCRACGHRWWSVDEQVVDVTEVFGAAARPG